MLNYWIKNRLTFDLIVPFIVILLMAFAFLSPLLDGIGEAAMMQSMYKNESLDFDIPSPSFEQVAELESEPFIESVFPYYYMIKDLTVNGNVRETNIFFSDSFDKLEQTMYCESRLIEKSDETYENPILIDYQFAVDTGAELGSTVSLTLSGTEISFRVLAIYETNTYYKGGSVMAKWEGTQKELSSTTKYAGAYVHAAQHAEAKHYFNTKYKPLGRLLTPEEYEKNHGSIGYETYKENFMSGSYKNEITDFSDKAVNAIPEAEEKMSSSSRYLWFACGIAAVVMVIANLALWMRNSEKEYFASRKILGAKTLSIYYLCASATQAAVLILGVVAALALLSSQSAFYVPRDVLQEETKISAIAMAVISLVVMIENLLMIKETKR